MNYLTAKLAQLTDELFVATQHNKLPWKRGVADQSFSTQIGDMRVSLEKDVGNDGLPAVAVLLCNREGRLVQRYTDHDLSDHVPETDDHRTFWELLTELHEMARWSAEGVFELIDNLMEVLSPPGAERDEEAGHDDASGWGPRSISPRIHHQAGLR